MSSHTIFCYLLCAPDSAPPDLPDTKKEMWQAGVGGVQLQDVRSVSLARCTSFFSKYRHEKHILYWNEKRPGPDILKYLTT
jgi:hypothetical protein